MAKKISSRDIFSETDIFKSIRDSATETIRKMEQLQKEVQETATALQKSIGGAKFDSSKAINNVVKATREANKLAKESIQIDKQKSQAEQQRIKAMQEIQKLEQQEIKTESSQIRLKQQKAREQERSNKQTARAKKLAQDEANAYKKLEKNTRALKNESKRLGAELLNLERSGKKNTKAYRDLSIQYKEVTRNARQGDQALKKLDKSVGDNFRNVGNYKDAIKGLITTLGALGAGVGLGQIFGKVTGTIITFDQAQADLAAISGKTRDELKGLNEQAKELGRTTQFTAVEITEMQIELAKLGFTTDQIKQSTEAVSNFAAATGADMASASKVAGSALRAFNLDATEMERVVSVLGVATTKSALTFASYETSLSTVAPVAEAFGFSIEDTTTLLAQLADAGFDASKSATATRNILLNLADSGGALAQKLGMPVRNADDLAVALQELDKRGIDLAEALELTDRRSVAAFQRFIKGADTMSDFKTSITGVNDELKAMAEKRLKSIQGQMTLLSSAFDGFLINMGEAIGSSKLFQSIIGFLARNLDTILTMVLKLGRAWVVYRIGLMAVTQIQRAYALGLRGIGKQIAKNIPMTKAYRMEQERLAKSGQDASQSMSRMGKALKGIGWAIAISLAIELATAIWDGIFAMRTQEKQAQLNAENERKRADAKERNQKKANANLSKEQKKLDEAIRKAEQQARRDIANTKNKQKQQKIEAEFLKEKAKLTDDAVGSIQKQIDAEEKSLANQQKRLKQSRKARAEYQQMVKEAPIDKATGRKMMPMGIGIRDVSAESLKVQERELTKTKDSIEAYKKGLKDLTDVADENVTLIMEHTASVSDNRSGSKKLVKELKQVEIYLSRQKELLQELIEIEQDRVLIQSEKDIDAEFKAQLDNAEKMGKFDATILNNLIQDKIKIETDHIRQRGEFHKQAIQDQYDLEKQARLDALTKERDDLITNAGNNKKAIEKINASFDQRKKELDAQEIKRAKDIGTEKVIVEADTQKKIEAIQEEGFKNQEDLQKQLAEKTEEFNEAELEKLAQRYQSMNELVKMSADFFIKQSQRRMNQIDQEIAKANERYETFKQLAIQGNVDAEQSLAEQQKIINEANKRKLQEEKRQQRIRLAESVFNTYSSKVQQGQENALAETIRDTSLLLQFINSIPAFYEGTENTGTHGQGVDGKGGFHAILHPNERVIPHSLNNQIGALTNEQLTQIAVDYKNGRVIEGSMQTKSALDFALLINEMSDLKQVIKNKPETNIELGEITSSLMEIIQSTKRGNSIVFNKYKIRK